MRGFFGVQDELDRMVETRDAQHRALRNRDPADELRFALILDLGRPAKLGDLEPQGIHLAGPLVAIGIRADLEPVQRLLHFAGHAPIQSVKDDSPVACPRLGCAGRGGGRIACRPLSTR